MADIEPVENPESFSEETQLYHQIVMMYEEPMRTNKISMQLLSDIFKTRQELVYVETINALTYFLQDGVAVTRAKEVCLPQLTEVICCVKDILPDIEIGNQKEDIDDFISCSLDVLSPKDNEQNNDGYAVDMNKVDFSGGHAETEYVLSQIANSTYVPK